jgi:hypothetical protein
MTISTTASRISYNGNGVTTEFSFPYRFLTNGDLVVLSVSSTGVETTKTLTTDYTLTGAGDDAGGSVTMLVAPAVDTRLIIYRDTAITQETDYISGDPFPAETHERALDRLTMIAQEIGSDADRSIKVPVGDSSSLTTTLPAAANRLDKFIVFDAVTGEVELSTITLTQLASAVAAAYASGSTADAVTFLQAGTGAVSQSVQAVLRWFKFIGNFGTLGAGNDAAIFQAALDDASGTHAVIMIPGNTTIQLGAGSVTSDGAVRVVGLGGRDRTYITWTSTTAFAWTHTAGLGGGLQMEGVTMSGPLSCTAGGAISIQASGGVANSNTKIKDCTFVNGFYQLYMPAAHSWEMAGNTHTNYIEAGVYTGNTVDQDEGDSYIHDCGFFANGASAKAVVQVGAGGLKIMQNKMYGGQYGYYMDLATSAVTSILIIQGNSIEFQTHSGIRMRNTGGSGSFTQIIINGNQFSGQPTPINLDHSSTCFVSATISDNLIGAAAGAGTTAAITVNTVPLSVITDNQIYGTGTTVLGISVGSGSFASRVENNNVYGCVTDVTNAVSSGVASATSIALPNWTDSIVVTGTTNITSIAAGSGQKGRTVTLMFQGILTFTDGNNLKLAGNFVTTADDTITLTCADGTNWYEVCRSVN